MAGGMQASTVALLSRRAPLDGPVLLRAYLALIGRLPGVARDAVVDFTALVRCGAVRVLSPHSLDLSHLPLSRLRASFHSPL